MRIQLDIYIVKIIADLHESCASSISTCGILVPFNIQDRDVRVGGYYLQSSPGFPSFLCIALSTNDHSVNSLWNYSSSILFVLDGDLSFRVGV